MVLFNENNKFANGRRNNNGDPTKVTAPDSGLDSRKPMFSETKRVGIENWPAWSWRGIHKHAFLLDPDGVSRTADAWGRQIVGIDEAFRTLEEKMQIVLEKGWQGEGADAATRATKNYLQSSQHLQQSLQAMQDNLQGLSEALENARRNIPTPDEVHNTIEEEVSNAVSWADWPFVSVDKVYWGDDGELFLASSADNYRGIFEYWLNQMAMASRQAMIDNYDPGLRYSDANMPDFLGTNNVKSKPTPKSPSAPDSPGNSPQSPGGPGPVPGTGGSPTNPGDIRTPSGPTMTTPKPVKADTQTNGLDALKNSLGQLGGLGSSLANQAQNLGKGLLNPNTKPGAPNLVGRPVNRAGAPKGARAAGKGSGAAGAGGGKGGSGTKPTAPVLKDSLKKATELAQIAPKTPLTASRATASGPMGGTPMGGGRGAGTGGGGQDKEHKANKFLQTTANGQALLGVPPATVSSVVAAMPGGVRIADVEGEASMSRS